MNDQLTKLTILPMNKTVVFYSPIEGKDVLVRTGTIADGSCFFHSLLHSYSKDYISMNTEGRRKFVKRLRSSLARKVDKDRWEKLSDGLIARIPFQENVNSILSDFYRYILRGGNGRTKSVRKVIRAVINDDEDQIELYKIILEMISINDFEQTILPSAYDKTGDSNINECKETVIKHACRFYKKLFSKLDGKLKKENIDFYIENLKKILIEIVNESEKSAYDEYIISLCDSAIDVDTYTIGLISDKFNRDIYFIDSSTRMPYRDAGKDNIRNRKSIIIMWTGGCHYEVVGRLLSGNRIQREFAHDDPLIKCMNTYLYKPEKVSELYPNLVSYLPKDIRNQINTDNDNSKEEPLNSSLRGQHNDDKFIKSDDEYEQSSEYEKSDSQ